MKTEHESLFEHNRWESDRLIPDHAAKKDFGGIFERAVRFVCDTQLYDGELYRRFAELFGSNSDDSNLGWRCEYWGKTMRGACWVCAYLQDEKLYSLLEESVRRLLSFQDEDGRISTYSRGCEFSGWDMWGRKYVLLGLQYFYEICPDAELCSEIRRAMCRQADYIIAHVGDNGIPINETSRHWLGINAMSILEPFVRLYNLTGEKRYLDFASYIVSVGEKEPVMIFALAAEDRLDPYQYPVTKAYEMMSCFEGLAEYYRVTGVPRHREAVLNFGRRVLESDVSVIGCCGCTHELFDHTAVTQTDDSYVGIMQETCVSVTLMKLCAQLLRLSGDVRYADAIERSFFNAYLGAFNTHRKVTTVRAKDDYPEMHGVLPFDSYSPLRAGVRGSKVGGLMRMENGFFYGCCACIASAGVGLIPRVAAQRAHDGIYLSIYLPGSTGCLTPGGQNAVFEISGEYPIGGSVSIKLRLERPEEMTLAFRIPKWSKKTVMSLNGENITAAPGWKSIRRLWQDGDTVRLDLDMSVYLIQPPDPQARGRYAALRRGAIVLAADARLGFDEKKTLRIPADADGRVKAREAECPEIPDCDLCVEVETADGDMRLIDYSSAGKTYDDSSRFAAWLPVKS